jgi:hypothetical protein
MSYCCVEIREAFPGRRVSARMARDLIFSLSLMQKRRSPNVIPDIILVHQRNRSIVLCSATDWESAGRIFSFEMLYRTLVKML